MTAWRVLRRELHFALIERQGQRPTGRIAIAVLQRAGLSWRPFRRGA
jgi:hypothetical protein